MKNSRNERLNDDIGEVYDRVLISPAAPSTAIPRRGLFPGDPFAGATYPDSGYRYGSGFAAPTPVHRAGDVPHPTQHGRKHPARRWSDAPGRRPPPEAARPHPVRRWNDAPQPSRARFASVAGSVGFFVPEKPPVQAPSAEPAVQEAPAAEARSEAPPGPAVDEHLVPHWERATRIKGQLDSLRRQALFGLAILDRLEMALVAAGPEGDIRFANAAAADFLSNSKALHVAGGRLAASLPARQAALANAIRNAGRFGATAELAVEDASGRQPCWILVVPLGADMAAEDGERLALLLLHDTQAPPAPAATFMRAAFGATPAEARLADALA
ncbi:MAG: hypothetical protein JNM82_07460, partial [Rhodocyclaceae bacterium]|nr:hypothetical protein [Rhodocyclaceae bacterium]